MIDRFFVHDILVRRPATKAGRGSDSVADFDNATDTPARGWVAQNATTDIRGGRTGDSSEWLLQTSATTDVRPGDRVIWGSHTFLVVGRPNPAWTPKGVHHLEARLQLVEG
jgi:hypothetical protein